MAQTTVSIDVSVVTEWIVNSDEYNQEYLDDFAEQQEDALRDTWDDDEYDTPMEVEVQMVLENE